MLPKQPHTSDTPQAPTTWTASFEPTYTDTDLRLDCARLANGDIDKAKEIYEWVKGEKK